MGKHYYPAESCLIVCVLKFNMTGYRSSQLCMPQKHSGREGPSEEERKEKKEKG